jgi:hypothetical protein
MSNRRIFLKSVAMGVPAPMLGSTGLLAESGAQQKSASSTAQAKAPKPTTSGPILVAFVISESANVMDIARSWEVFNEAMLTANILEYRGGLWKNPDFGEVKPVAASRSYRSR